MEFLKVENIPFIVIFFVPGFISIRIYELLTPTSKRDWANSLWEAIAFSCVNFALLFWLIWLINQDIFSHFFDYFFTFLILFVFPLLWPILLKSLLSSHYLKGRVVHPTPKAWDHFFGKQKPCWVLLHLKNGEIIGGLFAYRSFASSFPNSQDIYIEEVWKVDSEGYFLERVPQTSGMLIKDEEISFIEFFQYEDLKMG